MGVVCVIGVICAISGSVVRAADSTVTVSWHGKPVFVYNFGPELPKPFIHPLYTPAGHDITLSSPPDHIHHRGLMFAFGNVAFATRPNEHYVVFWGEAGKPEELGYIRQVGPPAVHAAEEHTTILTDNEWRRRSDDTLMLTERRTVRLFAPPDPSSYLLTWRSELTAAEDLIIGGTPGRRVSYYGLGLRVTRDMDGGEVLDSNGKVGCDGDKGDDAAWCAYFGPKDPVRGFAMFDHPTNPRHPTGWFAMNNPFGYVTASMVAHNEPYLLPKGETLRLCYGVLVFDGKLSADTIDRHYQRWCELGGDTDGRGA